MPLNIGDKQFAEIPEKNIFPFFRRLSSFIVIIDFNVAHSVYLTVLLKALLKRLVINPPMTMDYFRKPLTSRPQSIKLESFPGPFELTGQEDSG